MKKVWKAGRQRRGEEVGGGNGEGNNGEALEGENNDTGSG